MVYDWEQHKDVCFQLYIQERKRLEEIIQHMRDVYSFTPSKRAFQTQFKRWGFPSKQNPAHRNAELVARVKELWEQNYTQRDMLEVLNNEGYDVRERELMRVRAKNRWLLRVPNGMKTTADTVDSAEGLEQGVLDEGGPASPKVVPKGGKIVPPPEVAKLRKERHQQLKAESEERWASKKRRRRTRDYAGIPADPPGPPRFPSETTLDESKQYLALDVQKYRELREQFQVICQNAGVVKKTTAGPDKWQAAKDLLVQQSPHLQTVFWHDNTQIEAKILALDVICTDVTKRLRTLDRRMTIADAKNALGINPEQSRQIRNAFYNTLKADHFTSKILAGDDHWQALKDKWIQGSPLLQSLLAPGSADPEHHTKLRAMEILCRDVMKRLRDDQGRSGMTKSEFFSATNEQEEDEAEAEVSTAQPLRKTAKKATSKAATQATDAFSLDMPDLQIDPSLLEAAGQDFLPPFLELPPSPVAIYVRPHPKSEVYTATRMWLASLTSRTVSELREVMKSKWAGADVVRIDGVEKGAHGQEVSYLVEEDDDLVAYLEHVQERKAVFVAMLRRA